MSGEDWSSPETGRDMTALLEDLDKLSEHYGTNRNGALARDAISLILRLSSSEERK